MRTLIGMALGAALAGVLPAHAQYPAKTVRLVVPFPAGSGNDTVARFVQPQLAAALGQQVVIDNRAGAAMIIGSEIAAHAPADGYTMVIVNPSHAINATLMPKLPYDPLKDFAMVSVLATQPYAVVVAPSLPAKSMKDLIALAKAKPKGISYASSGVGSASHLATEMFMGMTGVQMVHVPYKGTGPAMPDLMSGRVPIMINPLLAVAPQVQSGRLRALAVTTKQRAAALPDLPTVAETVPGYEAVAWYLLMVPAKTPPAVVAKINEATNRALKSADVRENLSRQGADPLGTSVAESTAFVKSEIERWGKVIRQANVKPE
jgi:tripartite-type tricarboxylate transporter receptor subunit TctC